MRDRLFGIRFSPPKVVRSNLRRLGGSKRFSRTRQIEKDDSGSDKLEEEEIPINLENSLATLMSTSAPKHKLLKTEKIVAMTNEMEVKKQISQKISTNKVSS